LLGGRPDRRRRGTDRSLGRGTGRAPRPPTLRHDAEEDALPAEYGRSLSHARRGVLLHRRFEFAPDDDDRNRTAHEPTRSRENGGGVRSSSSRRPPVLSLLFPGEAGDQPEGTPDPGRDASPSAA